MKILKHNEIDKKLWDKTILQSETPWVFAQSFYLDATAPGWSALVDDNYKTILPLTTGKKFGIEYLIQPPFTPQLGLFGNVDRAKASEFFEQLNKTYRYISIELNSSNIFKLEGTKDKRTFIIDLSAEKGNNSNTKRNIAKAEKAGLQISELKPDDILRLSKKYLDSFLKTKLKLETKDIKLFNALLISSLNGGYLKTFVVKDRSEKICAIGHFISNAKHVVYLKGTNFDKNSGSMHFLMDYVIDIYRKEKVNLFDFGGGQSDSMAQFYKGFGAQQLNYKTYKINNLPKAIKWLKK